jgi:hypothetical protein
MPFVDVVDVGDMAAHVVRAGDDRVGAARHPAFDAIDVGLRVTLDPTLMTAVLGRMDRRQVRQPQALREAGGGARDEPVMAVREVEREPAAKLAAGDVHVRVHALDPGEEGVELARRALLRDAVHAHPAELLLPAGFGPRTGGRDLAAAARQHVHVDPLPRQRLGKLADVPCEPAFDDRRVLPRDDQDARWQAARSYPAQLRATGAS